MTEIEEEMAIGLIAENQEHRRRAQESGRRLEEALADTTILLTEHFLIFGWPSIN